MALLSKKRELSQEALAFEAGLRRPFSAHVERQVRNILVDNVGKLALAQGAEPYKLLKP